MSFSGGGFGAAPEEETQSMLGRAKDLAKGLAHPTTALFHLLFKTLALLVYMFGTWFTSSFVNIFIICVLLLAFDFWTVKNVSGRLMVGLRWWSEVQADGSTTWKYEAKEDNLTSTSLDITVFWAGLFAPGLIWGFLGVGMLLRLNFEWLLLIICALSLSTGAQARAKGNTGSQSGAGSKSACLPARIRTLLHAHSCWRVGEFAANIVGYVRCKQDARSKLAAGLQWATARAGINATMGQAMGSSLGSAFGFGSSSAV
eukprot:CAMPEP_0115851634 /NCGR_PEP_ID=MMETSP0287-20121206/12583_1 /TAXON_ID=412157 /ORGANISM="Chrysochromulina rotalis, Strain UIO044" /LENGTH=257 /DNA_ID=CAMNT_0003305673 /DNA_START=62 /DNA_END=836 /DNA_ORIENTATION=-